MNATNKPRTTPETNSTMRYGRDKYTGQIVIRMVPLRERVAAK